ncbi:hypothetical protein Oweho_0563 [Owenweeksia hongkongensis DSM 17368]|uniref:DUF4168 domain-containing protein n=1 Tax=Owenweeksia hongkongensis (strain DSM 17368 / CIP 108786 / JCM 12287 / NRRL B-23963 / UST20020801) TaxID=926562 RepID=G8R0B9_OWEHD|nr:DUF4168 domain-containing protein [Owenweeksia hongkongensis]AEV31579.1 hypothetical protein Oweho_0563 [Owenweeksia hongkongensis DSM 17368]
MTNMVRSLLVTGCTTLALMLSSTDAAAQQTTAMPQVTQAKDYSDAELQKFADATKEVQQLQMATQQQMAAAIQKEGMDPMKFQQMAQAQQSQAEATQEYTEEEQQAYANAMKVVMSMQQDVQAKMQTKLHENDMTMQEYQTMAMAIQQSPEMTQKVKDMMAES